MKDKQKRRLNSGLLNGLADKLDAILTPDCMCYTWENRKYFLHVLKTNSRPPWEKILETIYDIIEQNLTPPFEPSEENWRLCRRKNATKTEGRKEVQFEREFINARPKSENWSNQVPLASGIPKGHRSESRRHIDLVFQKSEETFVFYELKIDPNGARKIFAEHPLFATIEVLCYGMIYAATRRNNTLLKAYNDLQKKPGWPILNAKKVDLRVLAFGRYYDDAAEDRSRDFYRETERDVNTALKNWASPESSFVLNFAFWEIKVEPQRLSKLAAAD